jgi:hypothetical protein
VSTAQEVPCVHRAGSSREVPGAKFLASRLVLKFQAMEINQIKRYIKELEERTDSLRGYL